MSAVVTSTPVLVHRLPVARFGNGATDDPVLTRSGQDWQGLQCVTGDLEVTAMRNHIPGPADELDPVFEVGQLVLGELVPELILCQDFEASGAVTVSVEL